MPESLIVAVARSPIGRAARGSLADLRADDMAAQMVTAALGRVPQLEPTTIDDVMLGNTQPAGEAGYNLARVVSLLAGIDLPGTTVNRYCASSLQTTRMAFHAIKADEGHAFLSAGVETVSRHPRGASDFLPDSKNPAFADAEARTAARSVAGVETWTDPSLDGRLPDVYISMVQTAENVAQIRLVTRHNQDEFGVRSQNLAEAAVANGFWSMDIVPITLPDGTVVSSDDGPRPGVTLDRVAGLAPVFRPDGTVTAANCCPLNDGAAAVVIMSDVRAADLGITPLARIVSTGVTHMGVYSAALSETPSNPVAS